MKSVLVPRIEVYEQEKKGEWSWRILHPEHDTVIGASTESAPSREDCILQLKMLGRLITGWAVAEESRYVYSNNEEAIAQ